MTLDDIKKQMTKQVPLASPEDAPSCDQSRPWWVVVVNPRRQPPQPKFHTGHVSKESAEATMQERQLAADKESQQDTAVKQAMEENRVKAAVAMCDAGVSVPDDELVARQVAPVEPFRYFVVERPEDGKT